MNGKPVRQNYRTRNQRHLTNVGMTRGICAKPWAGEGEADSLDKGSYPDSSKSLIKGRNIGVKMGDHETSYTKGWNPNLPRLHYTNNTILKSTKSRRYGGTLEMYHANSRLEGNRNLRLLYQRLYVTINDCVLAEASTNALSLRSYRKHTKHEVCESCSVLRCTKVRQRYTVKEESTMCTSVLFSIWKSVLKLT